MEISADHHMYCLSYDIPNLLDTDDESNANLLLKRDIVWEIILEDFNLYLVSPVCSTIIFQSSEDFDFWLDKFNNLSNRMKFVLSQVAEKDTADRTNVVKFAMLMNEELNDNFQTDVVDFEKTNHQGVSRNGRTPTSRL